jgi:hypothetical protein
MFYVIVFHTGMNAESAPESGNKCISKGRI